MPPRRPRSTIDGEPIEGQEEYEDYDDAEDAGSFTVDAGPPPQKQRRRFSMWEALFDECRRFEGEWRRTATPLSKSTAAQLSSDIRNAYKREFVKSRLKGLNPDEHWDAAWGPGKGGDPDEFYVWIKYLGKRTGN
jgi:hypothetical protein